MLGRDVRSTIISGSRLLIVAVQGLNNMKRVGSEVTTSFGLVVRGLAFLLPLLAESVAVGRLMHTSPMPCCLLALCLYS